MNVFKEFEYDNTNDVLSFYYCNACDAHLVSADKPETGKFFCVYGHCMDKRANFMDYPLPEGEGIYVPVKFAICTDCLNK